MNSLRSQTLPDTTFTDPSEVLEALNSAFPSESNNGMFFTIWYGVYNKKSRILTYASGGHPPAILLGGDMNTDPGAQLLRTPNCAIGALPNITYGKDECIINHMDRLYLYSDGVYEIERPDGSFCNLDDFIKHIKGIEDEENDILLVIYNNAVKVNRSDIFTDDYTILEVRFPAY